MTNNIEAAARALVKNRGATYSVDMNPPVKFVMIPSAYFDALASALAHAARGEAKCYACGKPATCEGHEGASSPVVPSMPACDDCCGHGNEDGKCWPIAPTPPPATGMKCWRDVEGTLPARRDGDKVARVDPETAIPATGKPWCRLCCGPHIGRDHVSTPYADEPPATGEAGTREAEIRKDERKRCAKWHDERAETSGNERAAWWHKDCAAALRALPEAHEGGRG